MDNMLTITKSMEGNVAVLHLAGRLDGQSDNALIKFAQDEHNAGMRLLLLDLSQLDMLTSAGLRAFHTIYKLFSPRAEVEEWERKHRDEPYKSTYFKLAGITPEIYYVLNIAGFLHNIPVFADLHDGLHSFKDQSVS
ncbi:MAG: hypothetical protein HY863_01665 [Chloroflexi bacterium]|nr:hypothetical protein [Chloroflexota bacterium]